MAICGLRADSFPFDPQGEGVLRTLLGLLERAEKGFPEGETPEEWAEIFDPSLRAGYLAIREKRILLQPEGRRLLCSLRSLFMNAPPQR
jgi:hypothetical protein